MRKVELLRQLQQVDLDLGRRHERLAEVHEQLADRAELDEATADVDARLRAQRAIESEQVDLDLEVADLSGKLQQINDKLYGGRVKNPKELQDLAEEAEQFKRRVSSREDRLLECYERLESASAALKKARARHARAEHEWRSRQETLGAELAQLEHDVTDLEQECNRLRAMLDSQSLRSYDGLRRTRAGLAVVEVRQHACQGCRVSLPMNEAQRARTSPDLVLCPNCGRILAAGV